MAVTNAKCTKYPNIISFIGADVINLEAVRAVKTADSLKILKLTYEAKKRLKLSKSISKTDLGKLKHEASYKKISKHEILFGNT